jgi:hypothetical protein
MQDTTNECRSKKGMPYESFKTSTLTTSSKINKNNMFGASDFRLLK